MRTFLRKVKAELKREYTHLVGTLFPSSAILLYHRVADVSADPDLLSVSTANFAAQMKHVRDAYTPVTLSELLERRATGTLRKTDVAVTFDDGYRDNFENALPILSSLGIPATVFVTTSVIGSNDPFPWNKPAPKADEGLAMTREQLVALSKHPNIEIGAHTVSHPRLAQLPRDRQREEIEGSKQALEKLLGTGIRHFAYPFGGRSTFTAETIELVQNAGFVSACATIPSRVLLFSDPFSIPRLVVRDWDTETFARWLRRA